MRTAFADHAPAWGTIPCLLFPLQRGAAQYAHVTAEIEVAGWGARGLEVTPYKLRCVVGTNGWQMDGDLARNGKVTYWFTGTNLIERTILTEGTFSVPAGTQWTRKRESADGNPGRPVRESDFLTLPGRIACLAFCSAPCLKREGHRLFPPGDFWKEFINAPNGFSDHAVLFKDALGLPKTVNLYTPATNLSSNIASPRQPMSSAGSYRWSFTWPSIARPPRPTAGSWTLRPKAG